MEIKDVLVVGLGEIGAPLLDVVQKVYHAEGLDVKPKEVQGSVDILHVCFPYDEKFVETTEDYMKRFHPKLTLIESTVLPFTTSKIFEKTGMAVCHSPVRGRKADGFKWAYFAYTKFIGPTTANSGRIAEEYYQSLGFKTYVCHSSLDTEFMKILNTTYYGLMITWFQEIHRICKKFELKEQDIINFFKTNEIDSGGKHQRPVFYPGVIEGHCVIPNAQLLNKIYPSSFIDALLESNERRKLEMKEEKT